MFGKEISLNLVDSGCNEKISNLFSVSAFFFYYFYEGVSALFLGFIFGEKGVSLFSIQHFLRPFYVKH